MTEIKKGIDLASVVGIQKDTEDEYHGNSSYDGKALDNGTLDAGSGMKKWIQYGLPFLNSILTAFYALIFRLRFWYEFIFIATAIISVTYDTPMPTGFALLEILFWDSNKHLIHAVAHNWKEVVSTVFVGLLIAYLYLIVGLWTLPFSRDPASCSNMFQCTTNTFLQALSEYGISGFFESEFQVADNLVEALQDGSFWRFALEMSYTILVGQVILAVILAVIIDGMQTLRMGKIAASSDLNNRCFLCDLTSLRLEQAGENFMSVFVI